MAGKKRRKRRGGGLGPLSPGTVAKASAVYWWLYSAYKGVRDLYESKGGKKKRSKLVAILSIIFPLLLLWIFYGPSKEREE